MTKFAVILVAAGQSSRFKDQFHKKQFAILDQKPVWLHSAEKFLARADVGQLIVVIAAEDRDDFVSRFGANMAVLGFDVVDGGENRHDSVANGLAKVDSQFQYVAVHDAARPCIVDEMVENCFSKAVETGAAIPVVPVDSTVKKSADGKTIDETMDRAGMYLAQTPQVFRRDVLEKAYASLGSFCPTDEAQAVERMGHPVALVKGSPLNIKLTTRQDLKLASACLKAMPAPRFDAKPHPFADDNLWR
jgi:2-C-methyl-D-erythritol 4-phosphate cytidylyltransferase